MIEKQSTGDKALNLIVKGFFCLNIYFNVIYFKINLEVIYIIMYICFNKREMVLFLKLRKQNENSN